VHIGAGDVPEREAVVDHATANVRLVELAPDRFVESADGDERVAAK
jgi:hypothetical protein